MTLIKMPISCIVSVNSLCYSQNGMLSALPYLGCWLLALLGGQLADFLREKCFIRTVIVRKAFTIVGKVFLEPVQFVLC